MQCSDCGELLQRVATNGAADGQTRIDVYECPTCDYETTNLSRP